MHELGVTTIYIRRHQQNRASAGMMRKGGFEIIDMCGDPMRISGSGRTVVERFRF